MEGSFYFLSEYACGLSDMRSDGYGTATVWRMATAWQRHGNGMANALRPARES